jgi:hypothetical protein
MSGPAKQSSDTDSRRATWPELYQAAMLELDNAKLPGRISEARCAILDRAKEFADADRSDEKTAVTDALRALKILEQVMVLEKQRITAISA